MEKQTMQGLCKNCGANPTIRAHLIPRVFCTQVQVGKSHAAQILPNGTFVVSQSGLWDSNILCAACDNQIGELEKYAHYVFTTIRNTGSCNPFSSKIVDGVDGSKVLRFCASTLYKYSITRPDCGRIDLGDYQHICREVTFGEKPIPEELDAFAVRLIRFSGDSGVFTYRAPMPDSSHNVNMFRLMVGGMLLFIKLDRKGFSNSELAHYSMKGLDGFVYFVAPAEMFEEFTVPKEMIVSNIRLSKFLDQVEEKYGTPKKEDIATQ